MSGSKVQLFPRVRYQSHGHFFHNASRGIPVKYAILLQLTLDNIPFAIDEINHTTYGDARVQCPISDTVRFVYKYEDIIT